MNATEQASLADHDRIVRDLDAELKALEPLRESARVERCRNRSAWMRDYAALCRASKDLIQ